MNKKIISLALCFLLIFEQGGFAQSIGQLDISSCLSSLRGVLTQDKFRPLHLRYLAYDTLNNNFKLLLDKGDLKDVKTPQIQETTQKLLEYFFVGVSLSNSSFWVNLRPDSPDSIIDPYLAQTDVGKILLEADLQLKKDTAKFTSPENPKGKEYWDKLYKKAGELFGYDNITIPTLTRPWIVPGEIIVREANDNAYIYKATLKVQLEQDHLKDSLVYNFDDPRLKKLNEYSSQLIRELIIPELTKEVNISRRYAPLRQVYYSLIFAQWFKQKFANKGGFYSSLIDRRNLNGITSKQDWSKTTYFKEYQKSFQKGEYNIQQPVDTPFGQTIRSYFSGGIDFGVSQDRGVGVIATAIQKDLVKAATLGEVLAGNSHILPVDVTKGGASENVSVDRDMINVGKIEEASSPIVPSVPKDFLHSKQGLQDKSDTVYKKAGIIFDMDGTLYSNEALNKVYKDKILFGVLPKLKGWRYEEAKRLYEETEIKLKTQGQRVGVKDIFENLGVDWKIALLTMDELAQLVEPKEYLSRNPQLVERLRVLSSTHKIAVLSNNGRVLVEKTLEVLGIRDFVSVIVSRTELGEDLKPNPRAFEMVIDKLDLDKEDVTVIGDDIQKDIKPAEALGIKAIRIGEERNLYRVIDDLVLSKSLKLLTEVCADSNIALPFREAIIRLSKDKISVEEADAIDLAIRLSIAFNRGEVTKRYFYTIIRSVVNRNLPLITKGINGKDLFDLLKLSEKGLGLGVPDENGIFRTNQNITQDDLEASIRYLRIVRVLLENTNMSELMQFMPSRIIEVSPSRAGNFSGSAVLAVNDEQGMMHVFVDPQNSARVNIRQVPDLDSEGMSNSLFERATEIVPLRAYKSKKVNLKKFRGWDLLPDDLKNTLSDLFSRNLVPITLKTGEEISLLSVALETSRQNDVAPGRTGPLLYRNGFVIVKDANGRELLLDIKGIGSFDGTFMLRKRTIFRGVIDGKRLTTQTTVGRGYLVKSNADADAEHLQALEREPAALVSIQSVPVFQVDFDLEGQKFSLEARLSPGNRRMGQYWKETELSVQEKYHIAEILGKSVAGMLLEHRPAVHRAFNLENFLDPLSAFASYGNPGSVTYLDTQRRSFTFMQRWLMIAEERVTHKWGYEKESADVQLAQQFWNGFIDFFLEVVDFPGFVKQQLTELRAKAYSEDKRQKILTLIWGNYLVQRIFEYRLRNGYQPTNFFQSTYSGEAEILPPMLTESGWVSEEIALYDVLLNSEYGERHIDQIKAQQNQLEAAVRERYPVEAVKLIRSKLTVEFENVLKSNLNKAEQVEAEQIRDKFMALLARLETAVQQGEISPQVSVVLDDKGGRISTEGESQSSDREERFGVLAITGDPIHWGHLYSALSSMFLYKFDKVIILGPGKKDHKPGMVNPMHRQNMIEKAAAILSPFLVYSPIGKGDYRLGEEHFIDLVSLNNNKKAVFYYLRGDGSKNKMIKILGNLMDMHKASLERAKNVRLGVAFIDRDESKEEITVLDPKVEVLNEKLESQFNISSTRIKKDHSLFLVPEVVRNYILENGLYSRSQLRQGLLNLSNATIGITGATGDIGHSFINMVRNRGGSIVALVRSESMGRGADLIGKGEENLSYVEGDLFDRDALVRLVQSTDVVYHLGAVVGQNLSCQKENVFAVNAISTALLTNVINGQDPNKRIVYASSQRIYAIREREDVNAFLRIAYGRVRTFVANTEGLSTGKIQEEALALSKELISQIPQDMNIYDVTKLLGEMFIADLPNHVIARISNAYGPDYRNPRLINRLVSAIADNRSINEVNETRDFIYQDDLNQVLLALANGEVLPQEIDIASGLPVSTGQIKDSLTKTLPRAGSLINIAGDVYYTANQNSTYSEKLLGRKFTDIETGLRNVVDSYGLLNNPTKRAEKDVVVMDVGGTFIRLGVFGKDGQIKYRSKIDSPSFMHVSGEIAELQSVFIRAIKELIVALRKEHPEINTDSLSIAFPGPVNDQGIITGAATLWGKQGEGIKYDIVKALKENILGLNSIFILNDNSAAMLRYAREKRQKNISVVTISSGISHKIYLRDQGGLLMDKDGLTGEIGHLRVDFSDDAPMCDCGGRGHLGAVASGRGIERLTQKMAAGQYRQMYKTSILYRLSNGDANVIENDMLVQAIHEKDAFALMVLDKTTAYLADVLAHITVAASVEKFIIVGGFAQAVGQQYVESLNKRLSQHDFYGHDVGFGTGLVELGQNDGLDNLLGMGYFAREKIDIDNTKENLSQISEDLIKSKVSLNREMDNYFVKGIFHRDNTFLASLLNGRQVIIFVDKNVAENFGNKIAEYFGFYKRYFVSYKTHIIDGDEDAKTMKTALNMVNQATEDGANRRVIFLAIGGGAMMDTVGFAAQLYRRGVDYIRIPTTLLGIVDAAVGVKVGVNYDNHKNLLGAFYPPLAVVSDIAFLQSLDARQLRGGIAEILKVAIISNAHLFKEIEENEVDLANPAKLKQNPYQFEDILKEAAVELVEHLKNDFYEQELMRHVDFGHTMAHYFESVSNYQLSHGEAVAIDILISTYIAKERGILASNDFTRIVELHKRIGLPFYHSAITLETMWDGMQEAVSHKGGRLMMVIPKKIGQTVFIDSVSKEELNGALGFLKLLDEGMDKEKHKLSNPSSKNGSILDQTSSPLISTDKNPGGIDFRALPIISQPINKQSAILNTMSMNQLNKFNLDSEWIDIQNMLNAGIIPSSQRIKDYVWACCKNGELPKEMNKILGCIADIMRIEEERILSTETELKDLLVLIESRKSINEPESVFNSY